MRNRKRMSWKWGALLTLALGAAQPVAAFFDYENHHSARELLAMCEGSGLSETGSGYARPVSTFGVDVPFREGLGLLLPKDWRVQVINVPGQLRLTWEGERPWIDILHSLATKYGLCVVVDWDAKEVWLRGSRETLRLARTQARPARDVGRVSVRMEKADKAGQDTGKAETVSWKLQGGRMLDEVLTEWAKQADWQLAWNLDVRYRVPYDTAVSGNFIEAVQKVLEAYRGARIPLGAVVHRGGLGKPVLEIVPYIPFKNRVIEEETGGAL